MKKIGIGLYGTNGHQVQGQLAANSHAELRAVAAVDTAKLPESLRGVRLYATLDEMLKDPGVELVSLCSPRRADQADEAIRCLKAGKHVYGEKPSAMTERDLDRIIETSGKTGKIYHEMAGTVVQQPYMKMRDVVKSGVLGTVVQVLVQKCYPWHDARPKDEDIDGGLALQVGVYAGRFVEHIACEKIKTLKIAETRLGDSRPDSDCRMAVSMIMELNNGGLASAVCNYLNPMQKKCWIDAG